MATAQRMAELESALSLYESVSREKLLRNNLGDESMERDLQPILKRIDEIAKLVREFALDVGDAYVNAAKDIFNAIGSLLGTQSMRASAEYIANKATVLAQLDSHIDNLRNHLPPFVTSAILNRGFLDDAGIRKEYSKVVAEMNMAASSSIEQLKVETQAALEEARKLANDIEAKARRTAAKISVQEVQTQFKEIQRTYGWQVGIWAFLTLVALGAFVCLMYEFMDAKNLPQNWTWQFGYLSAMHIAALGSSGAFASFCMRIFRSQLHMYQMNLHRQRVANSIESFVESALTPEQRDFILARLVDSVVLFGNSGLLNNDNSDAIGPKLTVDNISRSLTGAVKSKSE